MDLEEAETTPLTNVTEAETPAATSKSVTPRPPKLSSPGPLPGSFKFSAPSEVTSKPYPPHPSKRWRLALACPTLKAEGKLVLTSLAMRSHNGGCLFNLADVATSCAMSEKRARAHLDHLSEADNVIDLKAIKPIVKHGKNVMCEWMATIHWEKVEQLHERQTWWL
jgi:hypothetical protein